VIQPRRSSLEDISFLDRTRNLEENRRYQTKKNQGRNMQLIWLVTKKNNNNLESTVVLVKLYNYVQFIYPIS